MFVLTKKDLTMHTPLPELHPKFEAGSIVKHLKSGNLYLILHSNCFIEASLTPAYVYKSFKDEIVWVRPYSEFEDGRFTLVHS